MTTQKANPTDAEILARGNPYDTADATDEDIAAYYAAAARRQRPVLKLTGTDGNAFAILGACHKALRKAGRANEIAAFDVEAMSGNYDRLLGVAMKWFDVR